MRITRHQMFMEIAHIVAKRSVCLRLNVGAIIVYQNNIISIGYNGPSPGHPHCDQIGCEVGSLGGCSRSIHAEKNAIDRMQVKVRDTPLTLYVTHSPCKLCAELIGMTPITQVFFGIPYRDESPIIHLVNQGIEVYQCAPNGNITQL